MSRAFAYRYNLSVADPCRGTLAALVGEYEDPHMFGVGGQLFAHVMKRVLVTVDGSEPPVFLMQIGMIDPSAAVVGAETLSSFWPLVNAPGGGKSAMSEDIYKQANKTMGLVVTPPGLTAEHLDAALGSCAAWRAPDTCQS